MFSLYKIIFFTLFTLLFATMFGAFVWVSGKVNTTKIEEVSDNLLALFRHQLDREKSNALFLSVALSDNKALKDALLDEEEEIGYQILIETLEKLKTYTFVKDIRTQIVTKDLDIFARSWDNSFAGMPLEGLRMDLHRIRKLKKPKVSIDPGRLLTIKATTPFKEGHKVVGYIEAIKTFDEITYTLRKYGIELLVLMEDRYLDIATLMRENPILGDFVVSNKNYNRLMLKVLQESAHQIGQKSHFFTQKYFHVVDVMRDSAGTRIGYYLLSIPKKRLSDYENKEEDISFFLKISQDDLYEIIEEWERHNGSYQSRYDKEFIQMLSTISKKDRAEFEEEAREILQNYTKEELINIILQKRYQHKKEGKIR